MTHTQKNAKNPHDLDLWPMTFIFSGFRAVVKRHVSAKFHQAACSGSWVIVLTDKKTRMKTIRSVATARTVIKTFIATWIWNDPPQDDC